MGKLFWVAAVVLVIFGAVYGIAKGMPSKADQQPITAGDEMPS